MAVLWAQVEAHKALLGHMRLMLRRIRLMLRHIRLMLRHIRAMLSYVEVHRTLGNQRNSRDLIHVKVQRLSFCSNMD